MEKKDPLENYENDFDTTTPNQIFPLPNRNRRRTNLSLFDLALEVVPREELQKTEYEENLNREVCEWQEILEKKSADVAKMKATIKSIDKSVLTPQQLAYVQRGQNLGKFAEDSQAFCRKAAVYLAEHSELMEMQSQLLDLCKYQLDGTAFDVIYDCLYKNTNHNAN